MTTRKQYKWQDTTYAQPINPVHVKLNATAASPRLTANDQVDIGLESTGRIIATLFKDSFLIFDRISKDITIEFSRVEWSLEMATAADGHVHDMGSLIATSIEIVMMILMVLEIVILTALVRNAP